MIEDIMIYTLILVSGFFIGWYLRSTGYRLQKKRADDLAKQVETLDKENNQLSGNLRDAEQQSTELGMLIKDVQATEQKQCELLKAEVSELTSRLNEADALLQAGDPVVHSLKLKLIEANNTIVRYKSKLVNAGVEL